MFFFLSTACVLRFLPSLHDFGIVLTLVHKDTTCSIYYSPHISTRSFLTTLYDYTYRTTNYDPLGQPEARQRDPSSLHVGCYHP